MPREQLQIARTRNELQKELRAFVKQYPKTADRVIYRLIQHVSTTELADLVETLTGDPSV